MNLPQHIVIIPDGNRHWAKKRGLPTFFGHREGLKTAQKVLKKALELNIPYLTFWGSSLDNITKRSQAEVDFLFRLFGRGFRKLVSDKLVKAREVKVNVLGRWERLLPMSVKKVIRDAIEKTKNHKNHELTILLAYNGVDEMTEAVRKIAELRIKKPSVEIDQELVKRHLWTKDLPPVDLVVRTGGEPHWSAGLMMWDVSDAQLYFSKTLWPDFSVQEFEKALRQYSKIERRFGK